MAGLWGPEAKDLAINELELLAVAITTRQWGRDWTRKKVKMRCDNTASCFTLESGACKDPAMMVAMRLVALDAARHHFDLRADYIKSADNEGADAASRGEWGRLAQFAERVLGLQHLKQVRPKLDFKDALRRMQRARAAQRRRAAPSTPYSSRSTSTRNLTPRARKRTDA